MPTNQIKVWIVCHRNFDHGSASLFAFSEEDKAYRHAARLIINDLETMVDLDDEVGSQLVQALNENRFEDVARLYHIIESNSDSIDVTCLEVDQHWNDELPEVPADYLS